MDYVVAVHWKVDSTWPHLFWLDEPNLIAGQFPLSSRLFWFDICTTPFGWNMDISVYKISLPWPLAVVIGDWTPLLVLAAFEKSMSAYKMALFTEGIMFKLSLSNYNNLISYWNFLTNKFLYTSTYLLATCILKFITSVSCLLPWCSSCYRIIDMPAVPM